MPLMQRRRGCYLSRAIIDALEPRLLMHGGLDDGDEPGTLAVFDAILANSPVTQVDLATAGPIAIAALPAYHSRPSASAKLFLDFSGAPAQTWGSYSAPAQLPYSSDVDTSTYSDAEQAQIYEIWARVSEKFSPFNIDVTTEDPGNRTAYQTLTVIMASDSGSWLGGNYGGIAYIGSFSSGYAGASVYVFPQNLGPYGPSYIAEASAHESGHALSLQHQSTYSGPAKTAEYNPGDSLRAPIMGNSYSAQRGLWWYGQNAVSSTTFQDDMAIIASSTNRFGYRIDDHPNTVSSGDPLIISGTAISGSGVIEQTTDKDVFTFTTDPGTISLTVNPALYGPMLNLKLDLYTSGGTLVASANSNVFAESLNLTVAGGSYRLVVSSNGLYGDVGQYSISGTIAAPTSQGPLAPTGLVAVNVAGQISLSWSDANSAESASIIQRSTDGVNFADYATLAPFATGYTDAAVSAGGAYSYRVYVMDGAAASPMSNTSLVTLAPDAPASLSASAISAGQINLTWSDVAGESSYRIDRSTDGVNFNTVTNVGAGVLTYSNTGLNPNTTYYYRVVAINGGGSSSPSPTASATTSAAPVPISPSNLVAAAQKNGRIKLTWKDNSTNETGVAIEMSTDGINFSQIGTVSANLTTYQTGRLTSGRTYWFRVRAFNTSGNSGYSNTTQAVSAAPAVIQSASTSGSTLSRMFALMRQARASLRV